MKLRNGFHKSPFRTPVRLLDEDEKTPEELRLLECIYYDYRSAIAPLVLGPPFVEEQDAETRAAIWSWLSKMTREKHQFR